MLISLLITLLIYALIFGLIFWVLTLIPLPAPWNMVIRAVLGLIAVIVIIELLLPMAGHPSGYGGGLLYRP